MATFARILLGLLFLPACYAFCATFLKILIFSESNFNGSISLLAGILFFVLYWIFFQKPVKAYVLGHELTHALCGMLFGAKASKLRVSDKGGSVCLTKTNLLITLAPYFFPFYTLIILLIAFITRLFVSPLPYLPVWTFLIGLTWAFHVLFTFESLTRHQPDILEYGRVFSWPLIFIINIMLVLIWMICVSEITFGSVFEILIDYIASTYSSVFETIYECIVVILN